MRNLFVLVALFLGITFSSFSQNNTILTFTSVKGKIIHETTGSFTTNFTISGLNSEAEVQTFKSAILENKNVKSLDILKTGSETDDRKATLVLLNNQDDNMVRLIKSIPCKNLVVDGKTYTKDQFNQIKADLKAKQQAGKKTTTNDNK